MEGAPTDRCQCGHQRHWHHRDGGVCFAHVSEDEWCDCEGPFTAPAPEPLTITEEDAQLLRSAVDQLLPAPLPVYLVTYSVEGGQQYELAVPGDASVMAVDGVLKIYHRQRPVLGITRVQTHPLHSEGGEHGVEAEDR